MVSPSISLASWQAVISATASSSVSVAICSIILTDLDLTS